MLVQINFPNHKMKFKQSIISQIRAMPYCTLKTVSSSTYIKAEAFLNFHITCITYVPSAFLTTKISNRGLPGDAETNCLQANNVHLNVVRHTLPNSKPQRPKYLTLDCKSCQQICQHQELFVRASQRDHLYLLGNPPTNLPAHLERTIQHISKPSPQKAG